MRRLLSIDVQTLLGRLPQAVRATILYAIGIAWSRGMGLLMVPVLTAYLPPAGFGRLELLSSAAEIGGLMVGAGLVETLFRFANPATAPGRRAAADVMGLALALGVVCLALLVWLGRPLADAMPLPTPPLEIWLLGVLIVMDAIAGVPMGWLRMTGQAGRHALTSGLRASVQAAVAAVLLSHGLGVAGVLAGGAAAATLAACALTWRQARDTGITEHPRGWPRLLAYGAPLLGTGIASFVLGSADRWLLADNVPAAALGHYALAARFALIVAMLMQPFDMWWYARRMALLDQPDGLRRTARVVRLGLAAIAVAAAGTAAGGPVLIALLAPPSYAPAMAMVPWLVLSMSIQMLSSLVNVGCYVGRSTTLPLAINTAAAAAALGCYLLLIPPYGIGGAIAATLIAQALRLGLSTVFAQRRVRIDLPYARALLLGACAGITGALPQLLAPDITTFGLTAASLVATLAVAAAGFRMRGYA